MRTRSSSNLIAESSTTSKHRNCRRSKQRVEPFSLEESPVVTMADQRTMAELLQAPTEGYGDAIVIPAILADNFELKHGLLNLAWDRFKDLLRACPHHGFTELHQLDTFYNALTLTDQDSLNAAAGVSTNAPSSSTPHSPEIAALVDAVKAMLHQKSSPPASVKAVEEICVTCGGPHPYHQCLATDDNVFPKYRDNIQGYVSAAAVNYNQGNTGHRPQSVANQIRPPGFAQPNVQNNQTRYNQGYNQNRGNNQGNPSYQAPIQQTQVAPSNELSNYKKINDANMKAMQNQINNVKNELRNEMQTSIQTSMSNQTNELKNMMASFFPNEYRFFPIPVEDSDSLMEEIDIFLAPDDSIPPGIENDDYDSEGDVLFLEELLNNDCISLPEYESFHVDFYNVSSSPHPQKKPPDDDVYFDIEPDTGILTTKVVDDISERYVLKPRILTTQPTLSLCQIIDTLFPFSSENEDKVFNTGILASKEEKSPHLLSDRGFKAFQIIYDFSESPKMIYGGNIHILDVPFLHFYPP
ncbi:hypothetical protein Tco_0759637 [Tanacetum coccineum]